MEPQCNSRRGRHCIQRGFCASTPPQQLQLCRGMCHAPAHMTTHRVVWGVTWGGMSRGYQTWAQRNCISCTCKRHSSPLKIPLSAPWAPAVTQQDSNAPSSSWSHAVRSGYPMPSHTLATLFFTAHRAATPALPQPVLPPWIRSNKAGQRRDWWQLSSTCRRARHPSQVKERHSPVIHLPSSAVYSLAVLQTLSPLSEGQKTIKVTAQRP